MEHKKGMKGSSHRGAVETNPTLSVGWGSGIAVSCGIGHRQASDLAPTGSLKRQKKKKIKKLKK